jgi:hypothetical protein
MKKIISIPTITSLDLAAACGHITTQRAATGAIAGGPKRRKGWTPALHPL